MADNITGIVLDIDATVLQNIQNAERSIRDLETASRQAAQKIKEHFDSTMVSGVNAFIKKIAVAQTQLGGIKMPTVDGAGISSAIKSISDAMSAIDRTATTGANRFSKMADAMAMLQNANPDPALFKNVADGITKIGNTSQQTIDNIKNLAAAMAQLARDIRTVQAAQSAQNSNTATAAQYNKLYKEQAQLIRDINTLQNKPSKTAEEIALLEKMRKRYDEIIDAINKLNQKKPTAASDLANYKGFSSGVTAWSISTPTGAIDYAKNAKSLNDLQAAYKNLKTVMNTLNPNSEQWRQMNTVLKETQNNIDKIRQKMGEYKKSLSGMASITSQMRNTLAATFSVSAISGYIQKMIETRAQFELQNTALRAIIQNKREADQIFSQVQQMALQSPFTILQMNTYVKGLAAYQIEASKLVGTTKMLADVSAGLGVSMERLTLAYGQVKGANYLRASELRQFTEAGLNMAGELAKYYSEVEGKMVSVGDVMDRISKRMVRFEDVEVIFNRITSAGGMFYDMQKKQSETLWGQMQRISDALSMMMNEMGQSNQTAISIFLNLIRSLISHWRQLLSVIITVGAAFTTWYIGAKVIPWITASVKTLSLAIAAMSTNTTRAAAAQKLLGATNPYTALATAAAALIAVLWQALTAQDALQESLQRVGEESTADMYNLISKYKELADTVRDGTISYDERKKALDDLHNTYKDILPAEMLQIENIRAMADGYKEATDAIRIYSAEEARHRAEDVIAEDQNKRWAELIENMQNAGIVENMRHAIPQLADASDAEIRGIIGNIMRRIRMEVEQGMITTAEQGYNRFKEILQKRFTSYGGGNILGLNMGFFNTGGWIMEDTFEDLLESRSDAMAQFNEEYTTIMADESEADRKYTQQIEEDYNKRKKAINDLQTAMQQYAAVANEGNLYGTSTLHPDDKRGLTDMGIDVTDNLAQQFTLVNQIRTEMGQLPLSWQDVIAATQTETATMQYLDGVQSTTLNGFLDGLVQIGNNNAVITFAQRTKRSLDGLSPTQNQIIDDAETIIAKFGLMPKEVDKLKVTAKTNYQSAAKDAKALSDQAKDNILKITTTKLAIIALAKKSRQVITDAQALAEAEARHGTTIKEENKKAQAWALAAKLYGDYDKKKNKKSRSTDKELQRIQALKKLLSDVSTEYDKIRKSLTKSEANTKIGDMFGASFAELKTNIKDFYKSGEYGAEGLIDALKVLLGMINGATDARKKFRSETQREIAGKEVDIVLKTRKESEDQLKKDLDEMFANYELTEELRNANVNIDLAYMVGGKPTTLDDIRAEIKRLRTESGDKEGAKNIIKILEDQEKKITQNELKEQKQRLKNYEKYLKVMYSDRAKKMIESYTTLSQMERDFQNNIQQLEAERDQPDTNADRKKQIEADIAMLRSQMNEASKGISNELQQSLAKADWESFKGSDIFTSMYQDLEVLSKKGIDALISRLEDVRTKLQSLTNVDPKAVKEVTQYIEKLRSQRVVIEPFDPTPIKTAQTAIKELTTDYGSIADAQKRMSDLNVEQVGLENEIAELETIIALQDKGSQYTEDEAKTLASLEQKHKAIGKTFKEILSDKRDSLKENKKESNTITTNLDAIALAKKQYQSQIALIEKAKETTTQLTDAVFGIADALGAGVDDEWKQFANALIEGIFQAITLKIQLELIKIEAMGMGAVMNSALGIIGWVATALQVVASLLSAIFAAKDKRLQKKIENLQKNVDDLSKKFDKLKDSIDAAVTVGTQSRLMEDALDNLEQQQAAYQEMINLENAKKKTDDEKIQDYMDKIDEINEKKKELYEAQHEKYGSTNSAWDEANAWVDSWLDAFKETGDGLDGLNDSWDSFYENLVKKMATSAIVGKRMQKYIDAINSAIDSNMSEYDYVDRIRQIGESIKAEFGVVNDGLKEFFSYAGIGGSADLLLSDLQKGIQNITESQAAAIEAYLNSMRFAVFEQNTILTEMLSAMQAQYGISTENPLINEVKAIRGLVKNIDDNLSKVIVNRTSGSSSYIMKVG